MTVETLNELINSYPQVRPHLNLGPLPVFARLPAVQFVLPWHALLVDDHGWLVTWHGRPRVGAFRVRRKRVRLPSFCSPLLILPPLSRALA